MNINTAHLKNMMESVFMDKAIIGTPAARVDGLEAPIITYTDGIEIPCIFYPIERTRRTSNPYIDENKFGRLLVSLNTPGIAVRSRVIVSKRNDSAVSYVYYVLSPVVENRFYSLYFVDKVPPIISNCSITLYNRYLSNGDFLYQARQIDNVVWENFREVSVSDGNSVTSDRVNIYIPMSRGADYLSPVAWNSLISKTGKFTIQPEDIVVKGLVSDAIGSTLTVTALKAKYDDVVVVRSIESVEGGAGDMRIWKVLAY